MSDIYQYSIVIPHYNTPNLLKRCIASIPNRVDVQVIVVDDNTPGNEHYMEEIPELARCEFYVTKDKKGAGHVRNVALPHIKGKKVIFADADDLFVDDFSSILDEYENDDSDIIFFNTRGAYSDDLSKDSNRNKDKLFAHYYEVGDINEFRYQYTEPWGKIYSSRLIKEYHIEFDETVVANDQMFSVKTGVFAKKIKVVNRPFYIVTVREGSLSYKYVDTKEKLLARFHVMARVQVFLNEHGYCKNRMMIFGHAVNLLRRYPFTFMLEMFSVHKLGISVRKLLKQILLERILAPSKRVNLDVDKVNYK